MSAVDRVARHERIARVLFGAYAEGHGRKRIQFPDTVVIREDAVLHAPTVGDGKEFPLGHHIASSGLTFSDLQTLEWAMFWRKVPNFRATELNRLMVNEDGMAFWWTMEGTTVDGQVLYVHEAEYFLVDEEGQISRWEVFLDADEFGTLAEITAGIPKGTLTWENYTAAVAAFVPECAPYVSADTLANLAALAARAGA
jgi:hypothetical protein